MKRIVKVLAALLLVVFAGTTSVLACCSLAPAKFSHTTGWVGEFHRDGKVVHILAYDNVAQNMDKGGNAMILPIPAAPASMSSKNMLAGEDFRGLVGAVYESSRDYLERKLDQLMEQLNALNSAPKGASAQVQVFTKGSYTVVLSNSASAIPDALAQVPENKRPPINKALLEAYDKWYPGWSFALCCFDNSVGNVEPLVWWFEPKNPGELFFPAVDEHSGNVPQLDTMVDVDHRLVVTSDQMFSGFANTLFSKVEPVRVNMSTVGEAARPFVPDYCMGRSFTGKELQGDFSFNINEVHAGIFRPVRAVPPGSGGNRIFQFADALKDYSLYPKLMTGWFLSAFVVFFFGRWRMGLLLLACSIGLALVNGLGLLSTVPDTTSAFLLSTVAMLVIFSAGAFLPFYAPVRNNELRGSDYMIACAVLIFSALLLPGWSSSWFPLGFAALVAMQASALKSKKPILKETVETP